MTINKLFYGDTIELMKSLDDESIDMVLSDAPYGMDYISNHRTDKFEAIESDGSAKELEPLLKEYINQSMRILKPNSSILLFCSYHQVDLFKQLLDRQSCLKMKNLLVWSKNNWTGGDLKSFAPKHELIWYYSKGRVEINGARSPDIISFDRVPPTNHPTEKPVLLLEYYIRKLTKMDAVVFDGFMGSGATAIAALQSGRNFIGAELSQKYFEAANDRIKDFQHKQTSFNLSPETDEIFLEKYDVVTAMTDDEKRRKRRTDKKEENVDWDWLNQE